MPRKSSPTDYLPPSALSEAERAMRDAAYEARLAPLKTAFPYPITPEDALLRLRLPQMIMALLYMGMTKTRRALKIGALRRQIRSLRRHMWAELSRAVKAAMLENQAWREATIEALGGEVGLKRWDTLYEESQHKFSEQADGFTQGGRDKLSMDELSRQDPKAVNYRPLSVEQAAMPCKVRDARPVRIFRLPPLPRRTVNVRLVSWRVPSGLTVIPDFPAIAVYPHELRHEEASRKMCSRNEKHGLSAEEGLDDQLYDEAAAPIRPDHWYHQIVRDEHLLMSVLADIGHELGDEHSTWHSPQGRTQGRHFPQWE